MIYLNKEKTMETLLKIQEDLNSKEFLQVQTLEKARTVLVNVDVIKGFCKFGALYSPRNEEIIMPVVKINQVMKDFTKIFFRDKHSDGSLEFNSYPRHCTDERESEIVDELKVFLEASALIFDKNSTNGFFSPAFEVWFKNHPQIDTFVVVGDCTDICVMTFALSLKTYCNEYNKNVNIIVPIDAVETFDLDVTNHYAELNNLFALYNLQMNGIKLVRNIK
jgi:nicotinamidase-related amidase